MAGINRDHWLEQLRHDLKAAGFGKQGKSRSESDLLRMVRGVHILKDNIHTLSGLTNTQAVSQYPPTGIS